MDNANLDKKRGLGRGLSALIPPRPMEESSARSSGRGQMTLPIEEILPGDSQPRQHFSDERLDELAASIKAHGVIQPILVRRRGAQYEIVAGERRWRAAQKAGLRSIPAVVAEIAPEDALTVALVENLQREDLNAIEEAEAYQRLNVSLGFTQQQIAEAVGKDRATITNALRLLKLPSAVRRQVLEGELSMGHARALLSLDDATEMERMGREAASKRWSVRQTERAMRSHSRRSTPAPVESDAEREVRQRLQRVFGARVELKQRAGQGTLVVHFSSFEELDGLMTRLGA